MTQQVFRGDFNCKFYSGTLTLTANAGDVEVKLPFDWTGGMLMVVLTDTATEYFNDSTNQALFITSYDSLVNSSYTTDQVLAIKSGANPAVGDKSANSYGTPKSATKDSFTLDDSGTTVYVKYFVWSATN